MVRDANMTQSFNRTAHDRRAGIVFYLLHVVPPSVRSPTLLESSAVLLSQTVLLLVMELCEERR